MTDIRRCACPCGQPLLGRSASALYVNSKHRKRAYRERLKRQLEAAGMPTSLSLASVDAPGSTSERPRDAEKPRKRPQRRRTELRVSYRKAVEVLAAELSLPKLAIESALEPALTPRQRRALFEKEAA